MATGSDIGLLVVRVLFYFVYTIYCALESLVYKLLPRSYLRKNIKGQIVLVTGGGSGIGRLMCLKFAAKGAIVVTWDVSQKGNEETVRQVVASGGKCRAYTVDLSDRQSVYDKAAKVKEEVGKVDILVNNAGIVTGKTLMDSPDENIIKTFEVNSICHFWTVKAFMGDMLTRNKGHIVTIASMAGKAGLNGLVDYCSSKFAAVGFHESLTQELKALGKSGVKTTVVCPMQISTGMFSGLYSKFLPFLEPDWVAEEAVDGVLMNISTVLLPAHMFLLLLQNLLLPEKSQYYLGEVLGIPRMMDNFTGRRKIN